MTDRVPIGRDHPETSLAMSDATRREFVVERDRILAYLCDHEPCTTAEIADALGIVRNQAAISMQALRKMRLAQWMAARSDHVMTNDYVRDRKDPTILWATAPTGPKTKGILHIATEAGHGYYGRLRMERARSGR